MKMDFKKTVIGIASIIICICAFTGCPYIKGEADANAVYTCSKDNMFGLEKVVVMDDSVVVVFDMWTSDNSKYGRLEDEDNEEIYPLNVYLEDSENTHDVTRTVKAEFGKIIVTFNIKDVEADESLKITGVNIQGRVISFNDGNLSLYYKQWGGECSNDYYQDYDQDAKCWSEIREEFILYPMSES